MYRTVSGQKLLRPLKQLEAHIFVTQQVVQEVRRNKVQAAVNMFQGKFQELKLPNFGVPDHLFSTRGNEISEIREDLNDIRGKTESTKKKLFELAHGILDQISRSEDEVSKAHSEQLLGKI